MLNVQKIKRGTSGISAPILNILYCITCYFEAKAFGASGAGKTLLTGGVDFRKLKIAFKSSSVARQKPATA